MLSSTGLDTKDWDDLFASNDSKFPAALLQRLVHKASEADIQQLTQRLQDAQLWQQQPWVALWLIYLLGECKAKTATTLLWDVLTQKYRETFILEALLEALGKILADDHAQLRDLLGQGNLTDEARNLAFGVYEGFASISDEDRAYLKDCVWQAAQDRMPEPAILGPLEILALFDGAAILPFAASLSPAVSPEAQRSIAELMQEVQDAQLLAELRQQKPNLLQMLKTMRPYLLPDVQSLLDEGRFDEADQQLAKVGQKNAVGAHARKLRADIALAQGRIKDAVTLYHQALDLFQYEWELFPDGNLVQAIEDIYSLLDRMQKNKDYPIMERAAFYLMGLLQFAGVLPWNLAQQELTRLMPNSFEFSFVALLDHLQHESELNVDEAGAWVAIEDLQNPQHLLLDFEKRHYVRRRSTLDECVLAAEFRMEHLWPEALVDFHEYLQERSDGELSVYSFFPLLRNTEQKETFIRQSLDLIGNQYEMDSFEDQHLLLNGFQNIWQHCPHPSLGGYSPGELGVH